MRTLSELMPDASLPADQAAIAVRRVTADSREVGEGDLFVAVAGLTVDGHDFVPRAIEAGAAAVVVERQLGELAVPCIVVEHSARALGLIAARLAGEPAERLSMIGITGTNGKTTTTYLIEGMLRAAELQPAIIGTVSYRYAGSETPAPFTTPTPVMLQQLLARIEAAGCTHVAMEVSSHALQLERVWGCPFDVAAFTHLSQDHLDLHGDMRSYLSAKLRLFAEHLRAGGTAVVNIDGDGAAEVLQTVRQRGDVKLLRCSRRDANLEVCLGQLVCDIDGLSGVLRIGDEAVVFASPLLGSFNADNLLLAAACCHAVGVPPSAIGAGIAAQRPVPGRLERVGEPRRGAPTVVVDYAHTPDALVRALEVLRPLCRGRLLAVFGCGGDRDRSKRALMGRAVARGADLGVVTSDNPRTEDPRAIIEAIRPGLRGEGLEELRTTRLAQATRGFVVEPDRRTAIRAAVAAAGAEDVVLIAGKGHEDYQIVGQQRLRFDDREEARAALAAGVEE